MLETLGNLGDFIGGIAVVIILVYRAIQVKQNTAALKAASWQETVSGMRQASLIRSGSDTAPSWARGLSHYPDVSNEDRIHFNRAITDEALNFQGIFALYESGQLEEHVYLAYLNWFSSIVATPGGGAWWQIVGRPIFVQSMVMAVDDRLSAGEVPDIRQIPGFSVEEWPES